MQCFNQTQFIFTIQNDNYSMMYPIQSNVSAVSVSDTDVGDQQMLITLLTHFQNFVAVPLITRGRYPVRERFPLSSSSSFAFNHPGQCNGFQLILSHTMTHKSDLPLNNHLT